MGDGRASHFGRSQMQATLGRSWFPAPNPAAPSLLLLLLLLVGGG